MNAPAGLLEVTQFAVLKAGTAQTIKSKMTINFNATMKSLNFADSRMPIVSNAVMMTITSTAGTFRTAPVDDQACRPASKA